MKKLLSILFLSLSLTGICSAKDETFKVKFHNQTGKDIGIHYLVNIWTAQPIGGHKVKEEWKYIAPGKSAHITVYKKGLWNVKEVQLDFATLYVLKKNKKANVKDNYEYKKSLGRKIRLAAQKTFNIYYKKNNKKYSISYKFE